MDSEALFTRADNHKVTEIRPVKFNIVLMVTGTLMGRMGVEPIQLEFQSKKTICIHLNWLPWRWRARRYVWTRLPIEKFGNDKYLCDEYIFARVVVCFNQTGCKWIIMLKSFTYSNEKVSRIQNEGESVRKINTSSVTTLLQIFCVIHKKNPYNHMDLSCSTTFFLSFMPSWYDSLCHIFLYAYKVYTGKLKQNSKDTFWLFRVNNENINKIMI